MALNLAHSARSFAHKKLDGLNSCPTSYARKARLVLDAYVDPVDVKLAARCMVAMVDRVASCQELLAILYVIHEALKLGYAPELAACGATCAVCAASGRHAANGEASRLSLCILTELVDYATYAFVSAHLECAAKEHRLLSGHRDAAGALAAKLAALETHVCYFVLSHLEEVDVSPEDFVLE
jgi:hypothetical protein